jgi:DNA-binding NarL/FixJ family response regulator
MTKNTKKILSIDTSPTRQSAYAAGAASLGLELICCSRESEWGPHYAKLESLVLLIVGQGIDADDEFRAIEQFRLSPNHASLPIALVLTERNEEVAKQAMEAGATEIFLQSESKALLSFMKDCRASTDLPNFAGKALLVEDDESHAEYVADLCKSMGFQVDTVDQVELAIAALHNGNYQLVITDVVLKGSKSGISLVRHISQKYGSQLPVIVTSGFDDLPRRLMALKNGVSDFINKPIAAEEFIWRVQRVMKMAAAVDTARTAFSANENAQNVRGNLFNLLSPREYEICISMMEGNSDKQIAANLGISYWTVRSHVQQIFAKTGAINRRELMARYISSAAHCSQ